MRIYVIRFLFSVFILPVQAQVLLENQIEKIRGIVVIPQNDFFYPENLIKYCGINFSSVNINNCISTEKFKVTDTLKISMCKLVDPYLSESDNVLNFSRVISSQLFWCILSNISTKSFFREDGFPTMFFVKCNDTKIRAFGLYLAKNKKWHLLEYPILPREVLVETKTKSWNQESYFFY